MTITAERLVQRVRDLFKRLGIECYSDHGQIPLKELHPSTKPGIHLEIDLIAKIANCGLLIEVTSQKDDNRAKINRFIDHCNYFVSSPKPPKDRLKLFRGLPKHKLSLFEAITSWKYVYIGTGVEMLQEHMSQADFPKANGRLHILNSDALEYILTLSSMIGHWAKYELFSAFNFTPNDLGEKEYVDKKYLRLPNHVVSGHPDAISDILLLEFTPEQLLKAGRVFRYGGLTIPLEESRGHPKYQRLLIPTKLNEIAQFIGKDPRRCFPNTVTLVLRKDQISYKSDGTVLIPTHYASIDIVDGQHRVLAYTHPSVKQKVRREARILATVIVFHTEDSSKANKLAARIFWEINSGQTRVKRDLLYLIKYDVLGDTDAEAIAGEVIKQCNERKNVLGGVFRTHPLRKRNRFGGTPISIVTVVEELGAFFRSNGQGLNTDQFNSLYGFPPQKAQKKHRELVSKGRAILERYFSIVADVFSEDWREQSESAILSTKYIAAFIRLLRVSLLNGGINYTKIRTRLTSLRKRVRPAKADSDAPTFSRGSKKIASTRESVKGIHRFLEKRIG